MRKLSAHSQNAFNKIAKALLEVKQITVHDLIELVGIPPSTTQMLLRHGCDSGLIERGQVVGGGNKPYVYFLSRKGIQFVESLDANPAFTVAEATDGKVEGDEFRNAIRLIAKPFALAVAKEVANTVSDLGVEIFVEELLREIPAQLVVKSVERLRTLDLDAITATTSELVAELVKPKKLRICVTGMTSEDEAKLRKEFKKEFTFEFVPSNDLAWILRAGVHADHVVLITGRPNVETANARLKDLGKQPLLVSGGFKEASDILTDLYLATAETD